MNTLKKFFVASHLVGSFLISNPTSFETPNLMVPSAPSFVINNRPLVRINGKMLSMMDVVKKMDILIYQHFPEVRTSPTKLFQFYSSQWKYTLDDMIYNELTILDGEAKEIKISDGDVREEMERRFGPNIISNLNKLNLKYDEVREMIHDELLVRQLQGMKVYSKAQFSVTPAVLKKEYIAYIEKNPIKEEWTYQVLSVKGKNSASCQSVMDQITASLKLQSTKLAHVVDHIKELPDVVNKSVFVNLSKDYVVDKKNLSSEHKTILSSLKENEYSDPISQMSKADNQHVFKIFHLKSHKISEAPSFEKMCPELENNLLGQAAQKEKELYKKLLFKKFGFDDNYLKQITPDDYQPFALK